VTWTSQDRAAVRVKMDACPTRWTPSAWTEAMSHPEVVGRDVRRLRSERQLSLGALAQRPGLAKQTRPTWRAAPATRPSRRCSPWPAPWTSAAPGCSPDGAARSWSSGGGDAEWIGTPRGRGGPHGGQRGPVRVCLSEPAESPRRGRAGLTTARSPAARRASTKSMSDHGVWRPWWTPTRRPQHMLATGAETRNCARSCHGCLSVVL
jgi:hypothetical protein